MDVNDNAGCLDEPRCLNVHREQARSYRSAGVAPDFVYTL